MPRLVRLVLGLAVLAASQYPVVAAPSSGECSGPGGAGPSQCLHRSLMPSTGIVADCRTDRDCRIGYYYGGTERVTWIAPPAGLLTMPKPDVIWHSATFAEVRIACGRDCTWSYFFEARRRQLSPPRRDVIQVDVRRLLMGQLDGHALVIRQIFSARDVLRIQRDWAPGLTLGQAITEARFDPDGRLTIVWLKGPDRAPVVERITVPSFAR